MTGWGPSIHHRAEMQSGKNDVWGDRRQSDPVLRAVIKRDQQGRRILHEWEVWVLSCDCPLPKHDDVCSVGRWLVEA